MMSNQDVLIRRGLQSHERTKVICDYNRPAMNPKGELLCAESLPSLLSPFSSALYQSRFRLDSRFKAPRLRTASAVSPYLHPVSVSGDVSANSGSRTVACRFLATQLESNTKG